MSIYTIRTIYYTYNSHTYTYSIRAIYMHILIYTCIYVHILCDLKTFCIHAHTCPYLHIRTFYIRTRIRAIYMHILAHTCNTCTYDLPYVARIFAKMKYVYARMMYVCCDVFARICTYCTYMHVFFVWKVARRIDVRIIAHTCIYLQIRTQIRANTCKYVRTYVQNLRIHYGFRARIFTYMNVYARIFQHDTLIWTQTNADRICKYMHVCVCMRRICMYIARICMYFLL